MSTATAPGRSPAAAPSSPLYVSRIASASASIVTTASAPSAASRAVATAVAPISAARASAVAGVRLYRTSECPPRATFVAIGRPMRPSPMNATFIAYASRVAVTM